MFTSFKDSTMDFIWAFGFVSVGISQELFNTTDLHVDVLHLGMGVWAFIRYWGVCDRSKLFVKLMIKDV